MISIFSCYIYTNLFAIDNHRLAVIDIVEVVDINISVQLLLIKFNTYMNNNLTYTNLKKKFAIICNN